MTTLLFLAHTEPDGSLAQPALGALGAALDLDLPGTTLVVGLFGGEVQPAANTLANCGAVRFLGMSGEDFSESRYASDAAAAEALCRAAGADIVVAAGTSRCSRMFPGVAHRIGGRVDTHLTAISVREGAPAVTRWFYRQRIQAVLKRAERPWFLLVGPGAHEPYRGEAGVAEVEPIAVSLPESSRRTRVTGIEAPPSDAQTIRPDASLLFVAGAGWTKKQPDGQTHTDDAQSLILDFLRHSRASLGSTKSLVEQRGEGREVLPFMSHLNQVGQTGSSPRHPMGLSTCCHGEEPHVVGWRFVTERRAVNLDPGCGWARGKADVLYVADAFEVMREVNALLQEEG
jgi:electron transfer flavoprotein alpha subunit